MISITIPLYNKENSIEVTIRSVLRQSYKDIELIIVDDGSTDASANVVRSLLDTLEPTEQEKVRFIQQTNGGPSKARNTGIRESRGEWIVTLDADDELTENALGTMADEISKHSEYDIINFGGYMCEDGKLTKRPHPLRGNVKAPLRALYFREISPACGHAIIKASVAKQYPYDEKIRRFEDYEVELRMLQTASVYCSDKYTEIHNVEFSEASHARQNIYDDFIGHLDFTNGGFWYKMCVYRTFLEERDYYTDACLSLYPNLYKRYDLLLLHKILLYVRKHIIKPKN